MQVVAVQPDIAWEDKAANHAAIDRMLDDAGVSAGAYVLLPELADTGFSFNLPAIVDDRSLAWARRTARQRRIWLQPGFAETAPDGRGRNCAAVISPEGEVLGVYRKVHPFSFGRETEHYGGGERLLVADCGGALVSPVICYDLRFPELWRLGAVAGAEVFTIGASWPEARQAHWRALLLARAIENQACVVSANRVGKDPHLGYAGGSIIIAPDGEILAEAGTGPTVLTAQLDLAALRRWRQTFPALKDLRTGLLGEIPVDRIKDRTRVQHAGS